MKPISNHIHTLNRYTAECECIEKQIKDLSMNCKTEWGRGKQVRILLETIRSKTQAPLISKKSESVAHI